VGFSNAGGVYIPVGVGAEVAVADNLSLKAQYEYHWGNGGHVGKLGLNFRFQ
jgi:outer membrane autotransporter protein